MAKIANKLCKKIYVTDDNQEMKIQKNKKRYYKTHRKKLF